MKKFLVLGAVSILTINSALATEIKPFIGANIALNSVSWDEKVEKDLKNINLDLPTAFLGLGAEAGIRLKTKDIYNPGVTLAYDYAFDSAADIGWPANELFHSVEFGFSAISATFDNYIRFSGVSAKRSDIVLGIGLANITERGDIRYTDYAKFLGFVDKKETDNGTAVVLKAGFNFELSYKVDFYAGGRWFVPTSSNGDIDDLFNLNAGIRYVF